ncbi:protein dead ringer isoform X2 [Euwallacea fornicatus]|uniref:protein dead ringer isoform X2 n=1 Tax=Euwallacea fornicatus TaxID=995702 RepID=UPI00338D4CFB
MEMEPQDREGELGDESPVSHHEEDMSDGEPHSGTEQDDHDSCDEIRRQGILADHNDVLTKLKMQVRDINVRVSNGLIPYPRQQDDFENQRNQLSYSMNSRPQEAIQFPVPFPFPHPATAFLPPLAPPPQPPSSGSSHSSEGSASSQHNWSFEEQFKQVRQLYELSDDPKRKEFLDELFLFKQKRGSPINRLPIMAKSVLDLFELYNLVIARGGLVDVINKKLWQEIIKGLHLPSSITSAAFTLRTQYMKYLYEYECEKRNLSTQAELQAAIDGNRREGRRGSYGHFDGMPRYGFEPPNPIPLNPLTLAQAAAHQQQMVARVNPAMSTGLSMHNGAHHPSHPPPMNAPTNGALAHPNLANFTPQELLDYVRLINQEMRTAAATATSPTQVDLTLPNGTTNLTPLELQQRMSFYNWCNNNRTQTEPQKEPINLSESTSSSTVKREPENRESPPPPKRVSREGDERSNSHTPESVAPIHSTHIRINSRGDSRSGENSMVVSMELDGVTYQGVLFPISRPTQPIAMTN